MIAVRGDAANKLFESLPDGSTAATVTLHAPGPQREAVKLRNVIGVLRGSDPQLRDTCIIVTAHYDHLGMKPPETEGDRIYNGANDDGSGVVSVIELAGALASMQPHPRRSIVFMTVFGEEEGLLGSQYYSRHPVFPLDHTVADVNLEQVGRTDDSEGPQVKSATFTGFTYSDLPALFAEAGKTTGVRVYDRNTGNDSYFARSDNQALADAGIPSHTVAVALEFPDYHQVGDEWNKIDYNNMTIIDRMLGLGIISLANDPESPRWNQTNHNTTKYLNAWKTLQAVPQELKRWPALGYILAVCRVYRFPGDRASLCRCRSRCVSSSVLATLVAIFSAAFCRPGHLEEFPVERAPGRCGFLHLDRPGCPDPGIPELDPVFQPDCRAIAARVHRTRR